MTGIYARGDRLMGRFLLFHGTVAACLAPFYETWLVTIVVTLCALGLFFVNAYLSPRSFATRVAADICELPTVDAAACIVRGLAVRA